MLLWQQLNMDGNDEILKWQDRSKVALMLGGKQLNGTNTSIKHI